MIVLRLADGSLLVLLPDRRAVRIERDGATSPPLAALTAVPPVDTLPPTQRSRKAARATRLSTADLETPWIGSQQY